MTSPVRMYADEFHARHTFLAGDVESVVGVVRRRVDSTPRVNVGRWHGWISTLSAAIDDPDHPDLLDARHELAYWIGESGDPAGALDLLRQVHDSQVQVLGDDHPHTPLSVNIA